MIASNVISISPVPIRPLLWSSTWHLILGTLRGGVNMTEELTSRFNLTTSSGFGRVHKVLVFHDLEFNLARDTLKSR
jgi:hypothetical protein